MVGLSIKDPIGEKQLFANRAIALFFCIVVMVGLLILRFVQLQVWEFESYQTRSDSNRIQVQPLAPPRGLIFDRHGELLADNRVSSSLTLVTERIDELSATIGQLAHLVSVTPADISEFELRLRRKRRPFEPVALRQSLSEEEVALLAVNRHMFTGVAVTTELIRNYPYGTLLAHAVGSVRRVTAGSQMGWWQDSPTHQACGAHALELWQVL